MPTRTNVVSCFRKPIKTITAILLGSVVLGCVGTVSRVDIGDEPIKDVEASDVDVRAVARQMAEDIIQLPSIQSPSEPVHIAFLTLENRTTDPDFYSYNILSKIRQDLIAYSQGKAIFLDDRATDAILAERDRKRAGQATSTKREDLPGVDYFLAGIAYSDRKADAKGGVSAYHRYSFRLTDAETGEIVWENDYEFKKFGQRSLVNR